MGVSDHVILNNEDMTTRPKKIQAFDEDKSRKRNPYPFRNSSFLM
jgi:hypothetical protein